jgi:hypothetical protein
MIPLYSELISRIETVLRPLSDPPKVFDFPQGRVSLEMAVLYRTAPSTGSLTFVSNRIDYFTDVFKRSNFDLRSQTSNQSIELISERPIPRNAFLANEKVEAIKRRMAVIRSSIQNLERENELLNGLIEAPPQISEVGQRVLKLRDGVEDAWTRVAILENEVDELRKENAMTLSRERGQIDALEQSVGIVREEAKSLEHRLGVLAMARAPPETLGSAVVAKKVSVVRAPPDRTRKPPPRKRIIFRKPKPPEIPKFALPRPKFIRVRVAEIWGPEQDPETVRRKEPSAVGSMVAMGSPSNDWSSDAEETETRLLSPRIHDDRDVPLDRFGVVQVPFPEADGLSCGAAVAPWMTPPPVADEGLLDSPCPRTPTPHPFAARERSRIEDVIVPDRPKRKRPPGSSLMTDGRLDRVTGELVGVNGLDPPNGITESGNERGNSVDAGQESSFVIDEPSQIGFDETSEYSSGRDEGAPGIAGQAIDSEDEKPTHSIPEPSLYGTSVCENDSGQHIDSEDEKPAHSIPDPSVDTPTQEVVVCSLEAPRGVRVRSFAIKNFVVVSQSPGDDLV